MPPNFGFCGLETTRQVGSHLKFQGNIDWASVAKEPYFIDITQDQQEHGRQIARSMGLRENQPFVCLYVRDKNFETKRASNVPIIPNADISDFAGLIHYLENRGFFVVRVGDPTMVPFKGGGCKFIDYIHTHFYSNLMDLYLYRNCDFAVSTMGGGRYPFIAYGRPTVVLNGAYLEHLGHCVNGNDLYLPKHIFSLKEKRFLSLKEHIERIDDISDVQLVTTQDYVVVDNTPEENLTAVQEFFQSNVIGAFEWEIGLQEDFYAFRKKRMKEVFYNSSTGEWKTSTIEKYGHFQPFISQQFLVNCWEESDYLRKISDYYKKNNTLKGY